MSKSICDISEYRTVPEYEVIRSEYIDEIRSLGIILKHKKSGARVVVLSNDDENKVFSIGFRTPPKDSTGVAHIVEHTVLCGSREFPSKDPFIELAKGSLNTFLNAMTYPDKTVYPIASCNEKDFENLMHVYMDAVFYPNIYAKREIFEQEGWHYELAHKEDPLTINGVVYNEMKGAFSSPEDKLYRLIQQSLFPDTSYGTESGGDPACIPDLTYEDYLEFHGKYYHPSNSFIYLYGDMDIEERLSWMDKHYLSSFEEKTVDSAIALQKPFGEVKKLTGVYSVSPEEGTSHKTYLSYNTVIENSLDRELYLAFQVLEYALLDAPGAPLKQALLDAEIGDDVFGSYENGIYQPMFSIIAKNADLEQEEEFVRIIRETLLDIAEKGLSENALLAAINVYEFRTRESDYGQYPKGLMYGLKILDSWLYDDDAPFIHLKANDTFAFLKEKVSTGYFSDLIRKYLVENPHCSVVAVEPKVGLSDEEEAALAKKLEITRQSMSEEQLQDIVEETKKLRAFQETPSTKEELEKIPMLTKSDLETKVQPFSLEEREIDGIKVLFHPVYTNGIAYVRLVYTIPSTPDYEKKIPYLSLLSSLLGFMDTKEYSYQELAQEINLYTGGMSIDLETYTNYENPEQFGTTFEIRFKALYSGIEKALELVRGFMAGTKIRDDKRMLEILSEGISKQQMRMNTAGHSVAVGRILAHTGREGAVSEEAGGIAFYRFLTGLKENFEEEKEPLYDVLELLLDTIFSTENLMISVTCDKEGYDILEEGFKKQETAFASMYRPEKEVCLEKMLERKKKEQSAPYELYKKEGFETAGQVQYVARGGNFRKKGISYTGSMRVLKTILSYDFLWNQVRVKGGAYGVMFGMNHSGYGYFTSYRDPNLLLTNEVYEQVPEYLEHFEASEREMLKYLIGTISGMDTPLTPAARGSRSFHAYMSGIPLEALQKERDEVLSTSVEDIQNLSAAVQAVLEDDVICVIGNEQKMKEEAQMFEHMEYLI